MIDASTTLYASTDKRAPSPLVDVLNLSKHYPTDGGKQIIALDKVSLSINRGEVLGIVGESGCGKSTLGRTLLCLEEPTQGRIHFAGRDITDMQGRQLKSLRKEAQIVFQDPFGSLNPQHKVGTLIGEPLRVHKLGDRRAQASRVLELLDWVDLPADAVSHYCHEFSGGQRQRIAIARALASNPTFLVCDEAVSALDVSIQSQILNLLMELQQRLNLTMLFISHDLSVIRHICDRVAVMYLGRIVETANTEMIMGSPQHPYTRALLSAIPHPLEIPKKRIVLTGEMPDPASPPSGCNFHTRCQERHDGINKHCVVPDLRAHPSGSNVACHLCFP